MYFQVTEKIVNCGWHVDNGSGLEPWSQLAVAQLAAVAVCQCQCTQATVLQHDVEHVPRASLPPFKLVPDALPCHTTTNVKVLCLLCSMWDMLDAELEARAFGTFDSGCATDFPVW